jgi:hypothetical protein
MVFQLCFILAIDGVERFSLCSCLVLLSASVSRFAGGIFGSGTVLTGWDGVAFLVNASIGSIELKIGSKLMVATASSIVFFLIAL